MNNDQACEDYAMPVWPVNGDLGVRLPTPTERERYPGAIQFNVDTGGVLYAPVAKYAENTIKLGAAYFIENAGVFQTGDRRDQALILGYVAERKPPHIDHEDWSRVIQNGGLVRTWGGIRGGVKELSVHRAVVVLRTCIPLYGAGGGTRKKKSLEAFYRYLGRSLNSIAAENFKNSVDTISAEYARVMTGTTCGCASSDMTRARTEHRIFVGYHDRDLPEVLKSIVGEMRTRSAEYLLAAALINPLDG